VPRSCRTRLSQPPLSRKSAVRYSGKKQVEKRVQRLCGKRLLEPSPMLLSHTPTGRRVVEGGVGGVVTVVATVALPPLSYKSSGEAAGASVEKRLGGGVALCLSYRQCSS